MKETFFEEYLEMLEYENMPKVLEKYLLSPSLVRLKNIGYFCGMDYASKNIYNFKAKISRYDHSLSVALITWKLTKDIKATLAGLFHDVSTPCFSHVIDYMNKDYEKQESTEEKTEEIIMSDKYLLKCLENDNIPVEEIIDFKRYSVVDLERPMLCADRLDGVILTGYAWTKSITIEDIKKIITDLSIAVNEYNQEEISLSNKDIAELILKTSELIDVYCHSKEDNYMMELLAKITKKAINLQLISYDDIYVLNEDMIFTILNSSNDVELLNDLELFKSVTPKAISEINMPNTKIRNLNPIVNNRRLK